MDEAFHGQSTKEIYRNDIEDSIKQKTVYKLYEYFDDYSYGSSTEIGMLIRTIPKKVKVNDKYIEKHIYQLVLFQKDGPSSELALRKLLEWRRSGKSNEVGHKGGGNKRLIYGLKATKACIYMRKNSDFVITCETKPNDIHKLSLSNITEDEFHSLVDTSRYVNTPEEKEVIDLPPTYQTIFSMIKKESEIIPNYMMILDMEELPKEFNNRELWDELINQVRAKQYNIPIKFKNEILGMDNYEKYDNIDTLGLSKIEQDTLKELELYIDSSTHNFYIKEDENVINVVNFTKTELSSSMLLWGKIHMFIVDEDHFINEFKKYNTIDKSYHKKWEDFYGVYFLLNGKLTNYLPISDSGIGLSKSNHISSGNHQSCSRFRIVIVPNNEVCNDTNYFNSLIRTETIKALSGFLDSSPYKNIIKYSKDIYKGKRPDVKKTKPKVKASPRPVDPVIDSGGIYLIWLGCDLWKFGKVSTYNRMNHRITEHLNNSLSILNEFNITIPENQRNTAITYYTKKTDNPAGIEEKIEKELIKLYQKDSIITIYENKGDKTKIREYFRCSDHNYIVNIIFPLLESISE